jgi:hypothetical protein
MPRLLPPLTLLLLVLLLLVLLVLLPAGQRAGQGPHAVLLQRPRACATSLPPLTSLPLFLSLHCFLQGNALGKGPVLFCFSAKGLRHLSRLATAGDPAYQQLELDMHRLGGTRVLLCDVMA